ncbi:MAG: hypothetical protein EPO68_03910 [Planctomycetota bacterium]|nr:MAG: hypothetical protein EPO68_03910 [Planctomycetota bacterium]
MWADGDLIRFAPRVDPELRARIAACKPELLALLRRRLPIQPPCPGDWERFAGVESTRTPSFLVAERCHLCRGTRFWRRCDAGDGSPGPVVCAVCHPPLVEPELLEWAELQTGSLR